MNAAAQLPTSCRPNQRRLQLNCRAEHATNAPTQPQIAACSRRNAVGAALLLPATAALAAVRPAAAEEQPAADAAAAASAAEAAPVAPPPVADVSTWPQWVDRNFSFSYPPGFKEADLSYAAPPAQRPGSEQVAENPLKAEVRSGDEQQRINVVVRQATSIKRTLFQVTDIAQLGDVRQVAKLLLPPGAVVASVETLSVAQPPKDTGTVLGVIQRDPVTYYCYDVLLPDTTRVQLTAAAQLGRVYVLAASAPGSRWGEAGQALREAALSFRLRYKL